MPVGIQRNRRVDSPQILCHRQPPARQRQTLGAGVTDDQKMRVRCGDRVVAEIPAHPLAEEGPVYQRPMSRPEWLEDARRLDLSAVPVPGDLNGTLLGLLASPGIARKQWVWEQYDHMVRINTVVLPGSDAAVIRVPGSDRKGLALSTDCNPLYCWLDPREGAKAAVAESARNVVCSGGRPLAITNCLNFGNPEKPAIMWQFAQAVEGIAEACRAFETPVTGGLAGTAPDGQDELTQLEWAVRANARIVTVTIGAV